MKNVNQLRKSLKADPNVDENEEPEVTTRPRRRKGKGKPAAAGTTPVKTPARRVRQKQASK